MVNAFGVSLLVFAAGTAAALADETTHATATIAVSAYAPAAYDAEGATKLVQIAVKESFTGDMVGEGTARFLQALRPDGSASFIGLERFVGRLGDKEGSFVLQDSGKLEGQEVRGTWSVVPGSGTGALSGIAGEGGFQAKVGEHATVTLDYTIRK